MKKLIGAIVVATAIFGAAYVSASALPLTGGIAQSGTITDVTCQDAAIHVGYTTQLTPQGNEATGVVLSNINGTCAGAQAAIGVYANSTGGLTAFNTWGNLTGAATQTFLFSVGGAGNPLIANIDNVAVMIRDN